MPRVNCEEGRIQERSSRGADHDVPRIVRRRSPDSGAGNRFIDKTFRRNGSTEIRLPADRDFFRLRASFESKSPETAQIKRNLRCRHGEGFTSRFHTVLPPDTCAGMPAFFFGLGPEKSLRCRKSSTIGFVKYEFTWVDLWRQVARGGQRAFQPDKHARWAGRWEFRPVRLCRRAHFDLTNGVGVPYPSIVYRQ
jgi:hypothetical protein